MLPERLDDWIHEVREKIGEQMKVSEDRQNSLTVPDARSLATSGRGTRIVYCIVQSVVDAKHHLTVAHGVTNVGHDRDALAEMARLAKHRFTIVEQGKTLHTYWPSSCPQCPMKPKCTKGTNRRTPRWGHESMLEIVQARLDGAPKAARLRRQTCRTCQRYVEGLDGFDKAKGRPQSSHRPQPCPTCSVA